MVYIWTTPEVSPFNFPLGLDSSVFWLDTTCIATLEGKTAVQRLEEVRGAGVFIASSPALLLLLRGANLAVISTLGATESSEIFPVGIRVRAQ